MMNNKFAENLKKIRKDNNLSQEQLADELGVSRQAISKWESSIAYPEMDKIITLCEKFDLNIDDLLHRDIREIKGEEESKNKLNKYLDDFLNFITNIVNMFSNMSFKNKFKCLFEQFIIGLVLFFIFLIIGVLGQDLYSGIFGLMPDKLYFIIYSIFRLIYVFFAIAISTLILVHIFKIRYLNYYEQIKRADEKELVNNEINIENIKEDNKKKFIKKEERIIIRDPKHSEYKFINGLFKSIVGIIKFFTLCFSIVLFVTLIGFICLVIVSFITIKTGLVFVGLLSSFLSLSIINIVLILLLLNFVFNRKNDKKKMIWSFLVSLIMFGAGLGLILIGSLDFKYVENDSLKTEYIEFDMKDNLILDVHQNVQYIESNNDNIKVEYTINKLCDVNYSSLNNGVIYMWGSCDNPIKLVNGFINNFNNKKISVINNQLYDLKIITTKENIEILKKNFNNYTNQEIDRQNMINSYEKELNELESKINDYIEKEIGYQEEINNLKEQIFMYENNE